MSYEDKFTYKVTLTAREFGLGAKVLAYNVSHDDAQRIYQDAMSERAMYPVKYYHHAARGLTATESKTQATNAKGHILAIAALTPMMNLDLSRGQLVAAYTPPEREFKYASNSWSGLTDDDKHKLSTGNFATVLTSPLLKWAKDTLKAIDTLSKSETSGKYRDPYYAGQLRVLWGDKGGSIVFASDAGEYVSEAYIGVNVDKQPFDVRITDFRVFVKWLATLKPDRMDIVEYRNGYARFNYAPVYISRGEYFSGHRISKPVASVAFAPMELLYKDQE